MTTVPLTGPITFEPRNPLEGFATSKSRAAREALAAARAAGWTGSNAEVEQHIHTTTEPYGNSRLTSYMWSIDPFPPTEEDKT
jgi:hypothetical protein